MYKIIGADQTEYGPVSAVQLGQWIAEGRANAASLVQAEGATEWKPLAAIPEFSAALGASSATPQIIGPNLSRRPQTNTMAIMGMILGVLSFPLLSCLFVFSVLGLVFSCVALAQINRSAGRETGQGLAITGIVLSCLGLVVGLAEWLIFGSLMAAGNNFN